MLEENEKKIQEARGLKDGVTDEEILGLRLFGIVLHGTGGHWLQEDMG
jgi:hypothetical protein